MQVCSRVSLQHMDSGARFEGGRNVAESEDVGRGARIPGKESDGLGMGVRHAATTTDFSPRPTRASGGE